MPSRKGWDQILAEGSIIKHDGQEYPIAPLPNAKFAELAALIKRENLSAYFDGGTLGRVDPRTAGEVQARIVMELMTDDKLLTFCGGTVGARWVVSNSLRIAGLKAADAIVNVLRHDDLMHKATFILCLSGFSLWPLNRPPGGDSEGANNDSDPTAPTGST